LTSNPVTAAANLSEMIGFSGHVSGSVIWLIKRLKGQKAKKIDIGGGKVRLEFQGQTAVEVLSQVADLYENVGVRSGLVRALEPLNRPGIDKLQVKENGAVPVLEILKDEMSYFQTPGQETVAEVLPDRTWTAAYNIVSVTFKDENKWRLSDGQATISASILDDEFLRKVDERTITFAKGDGMVCEILQKQVHTPDGIRSEYYVLKVIEFKRAPRQMKMFDV
jgi:hypothetical protein